MGRGLSEIGAADMAAIETLDLVDSEREPQSIEDGRRELNRAIAGWAGNGN